MMGRGGISRGRGGIDRGRGRGRGRGEGAYYSRFDDDGYGGGRGGPPHRSESWDDRGDNGVGGGGFARPPFGRGGREFDEPRHEFLSRSMSNDNWRESRKPDDGEREDDGSWRRVVIKCKNTNDLYLIEIAANDCLDMHVAQKHITVQMIP